MSKQEIDMPQSDNAKARYNRAMQQVSSQKHKQTVSAEALEKSFQQALNFIENNDPNAAIPELRNILLHLPDDPAVWFNLGRAYDMAGQSAEAEQAYRQALSENPNSPAIWFALGEIRLKKNAYSEAEFCLRKAHGLKPDSFEILLSLGSALSAKSKTAEAFDACQKILVIKPDCIEAIYNMAFIQLRRGDYLPGFANFEARLAIEKFDIDFRKYRQPRWDGSPLNGRSILIYGEQGMGDVIQFARYIPLVAERGGKVVFEVDPPLIPLFKDFTGVERIVPKSKEPPQTDVYIQLLSLPYIFGTTMETVPNQVPYISPDPAKLEQWRQFLGSYEPAYRIGLVWRGNPLNPIDQVRSCPLTELLPLAAFGGVQFFSLQVGAGVNEIASVVSGIKLIDHTDRLRDFSDTAAFIANLDMVIGIDTAVTHLAGALGKKVWVVLPHIYDWRWLVGRNESPWYPTGRVFWQPHQGDWAGAIGLVRNALGECLAGIHDSAGNIDIEACYAQGGMLKEAGDLAGAECCFRQIVEQQPDLPDPQHSLGVVLQLQGRLQEAIKYYRNAINQDPVFVKAHYNLANALLICGQYQEALESVRAALKCDPGHADSHWLLGMLLLQRGDFLNGWKEYEWRWRATAFKARFPDLGCPQWDGSPLAGKTLLIHMEQGRGDMIQFVRYAPLAEAMGGRVVVCVVEELVSLFATIKGISLVVDRNGALPEYDLHIPALSLPHVLGTTLENIPSQVPYIRPDQIKVEAWRRIIPSDGKLRVGLVWQGSPVHRDDRNRSCELDTFQTLSELKDIVFYSLQFGNGSEQLREFSDHLPVVDHTDRIHDFSDTAAFVSNLDLIISVDTAVAHLAGALGKRVWTLLPFVSDWRWLLERKDSPWYPTMRLFRQPNPGDWPGVVDMVRHELVQLLKDMTFHTQRGIDKLKYGHAEEAESAFAIAVALNPDNAEAYCNLGVALDAQHKYLEALACYQKALSYKPDFISAIFNMGNTYMSLNKPNEARTCYECLLGLNPDFLAAHLCLGEVGKILQDFVLARTEFELAAFIDPCCADAFQGIGEICQAEELYQEALDAYGRALELNPSNTAVLNMMGTAYQSMEKLDKAECCYRQALTHTPDQPTVLNNLAVALNAMGRLEEAVEVYRRLLEVDPDYADGHWNLSVALLAMGAYPEGWQEFEWRFRKTGPVPLRTFSEPLWDGAELAGRTILLHAEQGFGDTIQFVRYVSMVVRRGGTVILECQVAALKRLLSTLDGVTSVVAAGEPLPHFDCHLPLMSLPLIFGTSLDTLPCHVPYLFADPMDVEAWRRRMGASEHFRVGLVWYAKQSQVLNRKRSCSLNLFSPLWNVPDVDFYTLQIGVGTEQLEEFAVSHKIFDLTGDIGDFADTAALMVNLDLVITIDTAAAHLAGALGLKTWLVLPHVAEWRWLCGRQDSPWYPTMRLFRQPSPGDWTSLMENVAGSLQVCVHGVKGLRSLEYVHPIPRVGLAWSGRQDNPVNCKRSCPFSALAPLLELNGIIIVKLQLDSADAADARMIDLTGQIRDFEDTAALMANLDLIISIDTSVVHLAAASGRPTWVLLSHVADWRWSESRNSCCWYPQVELFRQADMGDWDGVVLEVVERLTELFGICSPMSQPDQSGQGPKASSERIGLEQLLKEKQLEVGRNGDCPDAHLNAGAALALLGRDLEAIDAFRKVLELDPGHVAGHLNLAYSLLAIGAYSEGWEHFEWRLKRLPPDSLPPWPMLRRSDIGLSAAGSTVLVHCEQGYGDTIMFSRFLPLLASAGYQVVVSCQSPLATLVATVAGVVRVVPHGEPLPVCDCQVLLLSIPWLFSLDRQQIPIEIPYLRPEKDTVEYWKRMLDKKMQQDVFFSKEFPATVDMRQ